ncbi:restriction endonuclease subunit S [Methanosphaera stadtmanae]|uniref:HsdS n=1 Tax=Methanosphaera stadtmanae (strain ATCC 43021 / DSM 3091 / JCM 11832 / MCB-3) TaxID=339860 RepID=Q2NH23_METST|nr:restriction endonuclease subunit S [Methanosphaera stadtmanae]ABC56880.1 HsdS [Methanosphaera stadtmanae DSM 3091]
MCKITKENDSLQRQTENKDEDSQELQCNKNIPELRFPEFEGEWITYKLCDVVTRIIRKNKNLETKRPLTISAKYGLIDQIEFFDKYVASKNLKGYYLLKKGEFAYNKSYSNGFPYGAVKRLDLYNQGAISTLYICFEITNKINSNFLKIYFDSNKWNKEMYKIAVEGARNHGLLNIPINDFFNTKHLFPSISEQEKIADFLSAIDKKIGFMEKEINKQSKYMKKIRENILNDNSDNSNKVQLKEICIINKGKQLNKTNMINDGKYYVLNGGKTPSGFTNSWNVPENTISISEGGNSCGFVNYNVQKFYCGGHCYYLTNISDEIDPLLLYHCLKMNENKIMNLRVGSGLPNIQKKDLEKYKLYIPTKNHEKITYLLNNINLKIDLNKEKLNHLKQFKKGLLQKMFC